MVQNLMTLSTEQWSNMFKRKALDDVVRVCLWLLRHYPLPTLSLRFSQQELMRNRCATSATNSCTTHVSLNNTGFLRQTVACAREQALLFQTPSTGVPRGRTPLLVWD